jgi:hypothetical protein
MIPGSFSQEPQRSQDLYDPRIFLLGATTVPGVFSWDLCWSWDHMAPRISGYSDRFVADRFGGIYRVALAIFNIE